MAKAYLITNGDEIVFEHVFSGFYSEIRTNSLDHPKFPSREWNSISDMLDWVRVYEPTWKIQEKNFEIKDLFQKVSQK